MKGLKEQEAEKIKQIEWKKTEPGGEDFDIVEDFLKQQRNKTDTPERGNSPERG